MTSHLAIRPLTDSFLILGTLTLNILRRKNDRPLYRFWVKAIFSNIIICFNREFYKKVGEFRKELVLQGDRQTFFIPIDQNADSADRDVWNSVDEKVRTVSSFVYIHVK